MFLLSLIVPGRVSVPFCIVTGKVGSQHQGSGPLCPPVTRLLPGCFRQGPGGEVGWDEKTGSGDSD